MMMKSHGVTTRFWLCFVVLLCSTLALSACGRKPTHIDAPPNARTYTYPPYEGAPAPESQK